MIGDRLIDTGNLIVFNFHGVNSGRMHLNGMKGAVVERRGPVYLVRPNHTPAIIYCFEDNLLLATEFIDGEIQCVN